MTENNSIFHPEHGWIERHIPPKRPTPPGYKPMKPGEKPSAFGRPRLWDGQNYASPKFFALDFRPIRPCEGCGKPSRPGRLLCQPCRANKEKYGHHSAAKHLPVRKILGGIIAQALRTIEFIQTLPEGQTARTALDHALSTLRARLAIAWKYRGTPWRPWQPADLTINRRLAQLTRHDLPAEQVLASVAGFLWCRDAYPSMLVDQRHLQHQLGRYVLNLVPVRHTWRRDKPEPLGTTACHTFGAWLIDKVGYVAAGLIGHGYKLIELPPKLAEKRIPKSIIVRALHRPRWRPMDED